MHFYKDNKALLVAVSHKAGMHVVTVISIVGGACAD